MLEGVQVPHPLPPSVVSGPGVPAETLLSKSHSHTLSSKPSSLPTSFPRVQHLPGIKVEKKILRLSLSSPRTQGPHGLGERGGKDNEA